MRGFTCFSMSALLLPFYLGVAAATAQEPLVIETEQGGQNTEFYEEVRGTWSRSESKSKAPGLSDLSIGSRYVQFNAPPHEAEAHFKPILPQDGYYRVSITWGRSGNVKNVKFVVEAPPNINKTIYMDQDGGGGTANPNGDKWNSLGIFKLPAQGTVVKVIGDEVTDITTQGYNFRIYTDAVKFEPLSESEALQPEPTLSQATPALAPVAPPRAAPFTGTASVAPSAPGSPFVSGSAPAAPATVSSPFGAPSAPAQPATVSSPFGSPATRPAAPATASSPFGAPAAPAAPATASSPFGAPSAPAAASTSSSPFPRAPGASASTSPFAGQPGAATTTSPFPAAPAAPAPASTSPFGAPSAAAAPAPAVRPGTPFGAPPATTGTSPFPAAPAAPSTGASTGSSVFGAPAAAAPPTSGFAAAPPSAPVSPGMFAAPAAPAVPPPTPIPTAPPISAAVMEPQPPLIQLKWLEYPEALINGKKANRPILLHFHSHIGPAKKFQDEVLSDPNVQLEMQRFVLARIYMQDQQDLVKYYHVERAPTLIFLGADGYTRLRIDGPVGAEQLATQLARQR